MTLELVVGALLAGVVGGPGLVDPRVVGDPVLVGPLVVVGPLVDAGLRMTVDGTLVVAAAAGLRVTVVGPLVAMGTESCLTRTRSSCLDFGCGRMYI